MKTTIKLKLFSFLVLPILLSLAVSFSLNWYLSRKTFTDNIDFSMKLLTNSALQQGVQNFSSSFDKTYFKLGKLVIMNSQGNLLNLTGQTDLSGINKQDLHNLKVQMKRSSEGKAELQSAKEPDIKYLAYYRSPLTSNILSACL